MRRVVLAIFLAAVVLSQFHGHASLRGQAPKPADTTTSAEKVRAELDRVVDLEFDNLPLETIVERLRSKFRVNAVLDSSLTKLLAMRATFLQSSGMGGIGGMGPPPPPDPAGEPAVEGMPHPPGFSCQFRQVKLGIALELFLSHYGLGSVILGDALVIASAERALELCRQQPVSLAFKNVALSKALADLSRRTGVDLVLDEGKAAAKNIQAEAASITLEKAVGLLATLGDFEAVALGKTWVLTSPARAALLARSQPACGQAIAGFIVQQGQLGTYLVGFVPPGNGAAPFLQTEGPAPRGQAKEAKPAPVPAPRQASAIRMKLAQPIDVRFAGDRLKDALESLVGKGMPPVVIDYAAFKEENPEAANIDDAPVTIPALKNISRARVLRLLLKQVQPRNATYLVRPTHIEITTFEQALPGRQTVEAAFAETPLSDALAELADLTGISIVLDARAGDRARTRVTARFQEETSLLTAVRLLADMADLKVVVVDNIVYVTLRSNNAPFPPSEWRGQRKSEAAA